MADEAETNLATTMESEPIVFKSKKRRNLRQIKRTDSENEEEDDPK